MRHVILFVLILVGLALGAYFTNRYLHHGGMELVWDKELVDVNLTLFDPALLYPEASSEILFGKHAFDKMYKDLKRVNNLDDLLVPETTVLRGWILKDNKETKTKIVRVYWNEKAYWRSKWRHLAGNSYITEDIKWKTNGDTDGFLSAWAGKLAPDSFWSNAEIIFGKESFKKEHSRLKKVANTEELFSDSAQVSRGWVIKENENRTYVARLYWTEKEFWVSSWHHLDEDNYVEKGTAYRLQTGWDGKSDDNRLIIIFFIFFEAFFAAVILVLGEIIFAQNEDWRNW